MAPNSQLDRFNPLAGRSFNQAMEDFEDGVGSASIIRDDGSIPLPDGVTLLPTGLKFDRALTEEEWTRVGGAVRQLQSSVQWLIGDWLNYGEREYGRTYQEIAGLWSYDVNTLYTLKWVASQVKISIRIEKLSFGHHQVVAGLESDEQRRAWLREAAQKHYSVRALRAAINGVELPKPAKGVARLVQHELAVRRRFETAARSKKAERREELRQFAQVQAEYWKSAVEALSETASKGE